MYEFLSYALALTLVFCVDYKAGDRAVVAWVVKTFVNVCFLFFCFVLNFDSNKQRSYVVNTHVTLLFAAIFLLLLLFLLLFLVSLCKLFFRHSLSLHYLK